MEKTTRLKGTGGKEYHVVAKREGRERAQLQEKRMKRMD